MGCNCGSKNRALAAGASGAPGKPSTYRVMVGERKVYETSNQVAANTVAERFSGASILAPGE